MGKESEVILSYNSLIHSSRPDISLLWPNKRYIQWAKETGYAGVELLPFRGAARDILDSSIEVISSLPEIRTGHVFFNPYATYWNVLIRKPDPLRPGEKLARYNLIMAEPNVAKKALYRLERARDKQIPIVTYPFKVVDRKPYGNYFIPWQQTHPAVFNDESNEIDLIRKVLSGQIQGVVWDTFHAMEPTTSGKRPLGDWARSLANLLNAGVVREIHVQIARSTERYGPVPDLQWAREITGDNPKYNNELGKIIKLVKSFDQSIPFVVEISPQGLFKAGVLKPETFLKTSGDFQNIHRQIIDYIKRV